MTVAEDVDGGNNAMDGVISAVEKHDLRASATAILDECRLMYGA